MSIEDLSLAAHVRACRAGDWLVFLDLRGDRYRAISSSLPNEVLRARVAQYGFLTGAPAQTGRHDNGAKTARRRKPSKLPDWVLALRAALWAGDIVRRGRLDAAFAWIARDKAHVAEANTNALIEALQSFQRVRPWLPWNYVCLFDSLCLTRYLIARGHAVELVIGVRARPFAAHCWVEYAGEVVESGGEDCSSFTEIARV